MFAVQGFKLRRKSRDPAKEIAEWYKIKGLVSKPKGMYSIVTCVCVHMYILMLQREGREKSKAITRNQLQGSRLSCQSFYH